MAKYYDYVWIDPERNGDVSSPFPTKAETIDNALYNALNGQRRKGRKNVPKETRVQRKLWRSLERTGWRIKRVYKKKREIG